MRKILLVVMICIFWTIPAAAEERVSIGFRVGPAGMVQDALEDVADGEIGIRGGGTITCMVGNYFFVGFDAEAGYNDFEIDGKDSGSNVTASFIPLVGLRGPSGSYLVAGAGYQFNFFEFDEPGDVEMDDSVAVKVGAGWDFFLNDHLALNVEMAWCFNKADFIVKDGDGTTVFEDELDASVLYGLVGVRHYF